MSTGGGGSKGSSGGFGGTGGGQISGLDTNLMQGPFEFGPSQFDLGQITDAVTGNQTATTNRYNQLGMGGSTPELQDLAQQANMGQATQGQEQTQDVTNPAFNPALQTAQTNIPTSAVLAADQAQLQAGEQAGAAAGQAAGTAASLAL
jgi:hypothetical protein